MININILKEELKKNTRNYVMFLLSYYSGEKLNKVITLNKIEALSLLDRIPKQEQEIIKTYLEEFNNGNYIFPSIKSECISRIQAYRIFRQALSNLGEDTKINQTILRSGKGWLFND